MGTLTQAAAALAGRAPEQPLYDDNVSLAPLEDPGIPEPGPDGPERVPVHTAWSRVMGSVQSVGKRDAFGNPNGGGYLFRGVDSALNAFGPACRLHGVLVLPVKTEAAYRDVKTSTGKNSRECTVTVTYRIVGPEGDFIEVQSVGESMDSADKGTAKALSTSLRSLLFLGGLVPTRDAEIDGGGMERGEAQVRSAASYLDEITNPTTSVGRLRQIHQELQSTRQAGALVQNEVGDEEQIGLMVVRIGKERAAGGAS